MSRTEIDSVVHEAGSRRRPKCCWVVVLLSPEPVFFISVRARFTSYNCLNCHRGVSLGYIRSWYTSSKQEIDDVSACLRRKQANGSPLEGSRRRGLISNFVLFILDFISFVSAGERFFSSEFDI